MQPISLEPIEPFESDTHIHHSICPRFLWLTQLISMADGSLLFRSDGMIVNVVHDAIAPVLPLGGFCVAWSVWSEHSTVLVSSDGCAYLFGEAWFNGEVHQAPHGIKYIDAGCGISHVVLLCSDGSATAVIGECHLCTDGTLKEGQEDWFTIPALPLGCRYQSVACGRSHTVLIRDDGVAVAFGSNDDGQCEIRDPGYADGVRYVAAACGEHLSLLVCSHGMVRVSCNSWCWVAEFMGWSSVGYAAVAAGPHHVVLLRHDGRVEIYDPDCRGYFGVLGRNGPAGSVGGEVEMEDIPDGVTIVAIAADLQHSVFLRSDGQAFALGDGVRVPALPDGMSYVDARVFVPPWFRRRHAFLILLRSPSNVPLAFFFGCSQGIFRRIVSFL